MEKVVYTNYWVDRYTDARKEHGSYLTEEEALNAIYTWWRIHKEHHRDVKETRTNTGALEITYDDDRYVYRIEKRKFQGNLPSRSYQLWTQGQIEAQRQQLQLSDDEFLFDELAEPYRDRLIEVMADASKVRNFCYTQDGRLVVKLSDLKVARQR